MKALCPGLLNLTAAYILTTALTQLLVWLVLQVDDPITKSELFLTPACALTTLVIRSSLGLSNKGDSKHSLALSGGLFGFNGKTLALGKNCHASELYQFLKGVLNFIKSNVL